MSLAEQVAELERALNEKTLLIKEMEKELDAAERELANRANELPVGLARIIKPWLTKTAVASRSELIDALPREHEALAQFLRAIQ